MRPERIAIQRNARHRAKLALAARLASKSDNEIAASIRSASDGFLLSPEWRALRKQAAERYGSTCCKCGREQAGRLRVNFDHIKPRKFFPDLALDIENLQPLCGPCNKRKGNGPAVDYRKPATEGLPE